MVEEIRMRAVFYYGSLQGWKVTVNGVKYPRDRGEWFTALTPVGALTAALAHRETSMEKARKERQ